MSFQKSGKALRHARFRGVQQRVRDPPIAMANDGGALRKGTRARNDNRGGLRSASNHPCQQR